MIDSAMPPSAGGQHPEDRLGNPLLDERLRLGPISRYDEKRNRLARKYAYAVPNTDALDAIAEASATGVVEIGAGSGYWARLLHDRGVDVIAFDRFPPESGDNLFVDAASCWFNVQRGDENSVVDQADRTLLLVWPTWEEAWPGATVAAYHAAGGRAVAFVGEGPGGRTGDSVLHALLGAHGGCVACRFGVADSPCICGISPQWALVRRVPIPQWGEAADACCIYARIDAVPSSSHMRRPNRKPWRRRSTSSYDE